MAKIAVIGATGTAGSRVRAKLKGRDIPVAEISRSHGVDLISREGLSAALAGVDVAVDASIVFPADDTLDIEESLSAAAWNMLDACTSQRVQRVVLLTIARIDNPVFDNFPYYRAKRAQKEIMLSNGAACTIVKSTHWHEFATNPAAVTFGEDEVVVEDWLIQPVSADTVADVLVEAALGGAGRPQTITGPDVVRLPELTAKLLQRQEDTRPVRAVAAQLPASTEGALLAPGDAAIIGPDVDTWLQTS
jgi:uncharacterized protein YbjT (DUF2867 family)